MPYSTEQILSLSPNPGNASRGKALANTSKWNNTGNTESSIWGECKGSGSKPYYTAIDVNGPAFKCSCPSREFPCKHGIGLFLLFVTNPANFNNSTAPDWVSEWLKKREQTEAKKEKAVAPKSEEEKAKSDAEAEKKAEKKEEALETGLTDLKRWLEDIFNFGLGSINTSDKMFWGDQAARMVDLQAPGLGNMIREIPDFFYRNHWPELVLERLSEVNLLVEGFYNRKQLPESVQADILDRIGINIKKDKVLESEGIHDFWQILGTIQEEDERLKIRRTWIKGQQTRSFALILDFAFGNQSFTETYLAGNSFHAEIVYYPSNLPIRALVKQKKEEKRGQLSWEGHTTVEAFLQTYAEALGKNPLLGTFPCLFNNIIPVKDLDKFFVVGKDAMGLPLSSGFNDTKINKLIALSGGHPIHLFGEWKNNEILPISVQTETGFFIL